LALSRPVDPVVTPASEVKTFPTSLTALRPGRHVPIVVALTALAVFAAACGNSGPSQGALAGKTATAITGISIKAFHRQSSVQFATKTIVGTTTTLETGATSVTGNAAETVTTDGHPTLESVLVDHIAYIQTTTAVLEHALNLSSSVATAYSGKWISLQEGDAEYQSVVNSLAPTQSIIQFVPEEPNLRVAGATSVGGKGVVAVTGSSSGQVESGDTAGLTLFVSTSSPYLPVSASVEVKDGAGKSVERVASVYGKWNEPVDPIAPKGATPISTLTS
jgi:hypothetical protein